MSWWSRFFTRSRRGGGTILLYHRVTNLAFDPQWLAVSPENFPSHLEVLRRRCELLSLEAMCARRAAGEPLHRTVALTFDDGYADNLLEAKPILARYQAPATVFVTSGRLDRPGEFWWDELEDLVFRPPELPATCQLALARKDHVWRLDGDPRSAVAPGRSLWNVTQTESPTPRHRFYRELAPRLRDLDEDSRESALRQLAEWGGVDRRERASHRGLRRAEVRTLVEGGGLEVGSHTVSHAVLARLSPSQQRTELEESRRTLEHITGRPVRALSYPFGSPGDYGPETVRLAQETGYLWACANAEGKVGPRSSPFELPRFLVRDWDGPTFERQLEAWLARPF